MKVEHADRRLNMRLSSEQEDLLKAAATRQGQSLTGFVLGAATERAQEVVEKAQRIELSRQEFDRFSKALDSPVEPMPALRRYARS
jgi:uncharacterized protein (DUF1778 family)